MPARESPEYQETERPEYQDNTDVRNQPLRGVVPEKQDVDGDHDGYQRQHVQDDGYLPCHGFVLQGATERGKSDLCQPRTFSLLTGHYGWA